MFCNQCEQTLPNTACHVVGVCGKNDETATLQDLIVLALRGLSLVALQAAEKGVTEPGTGRLTAAALFSTLTNVNFDAAALMETLQNVAAARNALAEKASIERTLPAAAFEPMKTRPGLRGQASLGAITQLARDPDCNSLAQTLLFGLKGVAAYLDHAAVLEREDPELYTALWRGLALGFDGKTPDLGIWLGAVMDCGRTNLAAMALLNDANTGTYGNPEPTPVSLTPLPGKAILVTGHDLKDLHDLLVQTENTGIQIYTHGEMLPAHGYPALKRFSHLAGHFGTAWQNQQAELPNFPGAILFTTNCIQRPAPTYADNVFTTGLVGWPGIAHVKNGDFAPVIARALELPGFDLKDTASMPVRSVTTGFAKNAVLSVADKILDGAKSGKIRHFFLVGGCDGAKPGRNYYTEFVERAPADTLVLTLACGKFRFFDKDLGNIDGIPRLIDIGQCNDAHSAVEIAIALANALECGVNDLPLSLVLSWYEQKAVAILLSLLALGIKNIRLGPTLPAFLTPNIINHLVEQYGIMPIATPEEDLKAILGKAA